MRQCIPLERSSAVKPNAMFGNHGGPDVVDAEGLIEMTYQDLDNSRSAA